MEPIYRDLDVCSDIISWNIFDLENCRHKYSHTPWKYIPTQSNICKCLLVLLRNS